MNEEIETVPATELHDGEQAADVPAPEEPALRILRKESCPSVSGRSTLTYHIGVDDFGIVHLRIFANTGKGMWCKGWIPMSAIHELLGEASQDKTLTSGSLHALFMGKSVNTAGFLLAVLKNEGLIRTVPGSLRSYQRIEPNTFNADIRALIDAGVSLDELPIQKPIAKPSRKQASRKPKEG